MSEPPAPPPGDDGRVLAPGSVVGILGGGQLGRMIALAAARLGLSVHVYCPDPESPAFDVARDHTVAEYEDEAALAAFAAAVDVVTYEFENVPDRTAAFLAERVPVRPGARSLAVSQDRLSEKRFMLEIGAAVAPFVRIDCAADIPAGIAELGLPAVLKTRRLGYDGKGQAVLRAGYDAEEAFRRLGGAPSILEGFVPFALECSVVLARGLDGAVAVYDVAENHHSHHILATSRVPATIDGDTAAEARRLGAAVAEALGHVGVLAVEMFVVRDGGGERLLVNEIAPRVHNSGHWTEDAAVTSQFEQHVRAVAGWPLGSTETLFPVEMRNLVGDEALSWGEILADPGARLHLYGKRQVRAGRKMGHVNHRIG